MSSILRKLLLVTSLAWFAGAAQADDLEGVIESVDTAQRSFTVHGITFYTMPGTDFDDGLRRFEDLEVGQRVEVDFEYREGRHYATEVELDN